MEYKERKSLPENIHDIIPHPIDNDLIYIVNNVEETLYLYNIETEERLWTKNVRLDINDVSVSPNGRWLVYPQNTNNEEDDIAVRKLNASTGEEIEHYIFDYDDILLTLATNTDIVVIRGNHININNGEYMTIHVRNPYRMMLSNTGKFFIIFGENMAVMYDENYSFIKFFTNRTLDISFSQDDTLMLVLTELNRFKIFSTDSMETIYHFTHRAGSNLRYYYAMIHPTELIYFVQGNHGIDIYTIEPLNLIQHISAGGDIFKLSRDGDKIFSGNNSGVRYFSNSVSSAELEELFGDIKNAASVI